MRGARDFPLEMLVPLETRATTDADGQVQQTRWLDRLFADTMAIRLGVTFESVEPGGQSYPRHHRRRRVEAARPGGSGGRRRMDDGRHQARTGGPRRTPA